MLHSQQLRAIALRRPLASISQSNQHPSRVLIRASSLSAIHRGLRHSERAQYGGTRQPRDSFGGRRRETPDRNFKRRSSFDDEEKDEFASKFKARATDGPSSYRQQQKLRKKLAKKKEEEDDDDYRRTRRKRFADSEFNFGKKSMVYRLKYGDLKETASNLKIQEFVRPRSFRDAKRDNAPIRRQLWEDENHQSSFAPSGQESRRPEQRDHHDELDDPSTQARMRKKGMMPMTVKYTTAASQFLYGRSVVRAALEQGRRQLYNLYIYGGENRRDSRDDGIMTHLAKKHDIPVTIVPTDEQRLMDKMSMGRPHNGYVLEASPLPQRPIKSLGKLEETTTRLGFHVELDYQTKEEQAINGTETFIRRANDVMPKPFVLLLNEILDPGNLGGILRTASYLGIDAVGITSRGSSTLTPVVLKSAAGAVEEITLFTVDDPVQFLEDSSKAGWKTFAAVAPPDKKLVRKHSGKFISTEEIQSKTPLNEHPCVLVLGNEGYGLPKQLKVAADYELSVPKFVRGGCVDSLNVSVAAGLLCHSFVQEAPEEAPLIEDNVAVRTKEIIDLVAKIGLKSTGNGAAPESTIDESGDQDQKKKKAEETELGF